MSIKEKAREIKGYATAALSPGGRADGLPTVLIVVMVALASYALGYKSAENTGALPPPVPLMVRDESIVAGGAGNESTTHASTTVETATPPTIEREQALETDSDATHGVYVGSRKGTKYHLPWCAGAKTISEANKVWFASKEEAVARGYTPAQNCKGI